MQQNTHTHTHKQTQKDIKMCVFIKYIYKTYEVHKAIKLKIITATICTAIPTQNNLVNNIGLSVYSYHYTQQTNNKTIVCLL